MVETEEMVIAVGVTEDVHRPVIAKFFFVLLFFFVSLAGFMFRTVASLSHPHLREYSTPFYAAFQLPSFIQCI